MSILRPSSLLDEQGKIMADDNDDEQFSLLVFGFGSFEERKQKEIGKLLHTEV